MKKTVYCITETDAYGYARVIKEMYFIKKNAEKRLETIKPNWDKEDLKIEEQEIDIPNDSLEYFKTSQ